MEKLTKGQETVKRVLGGGGTGAFAEANPQLYLSSTDTAKEKMPPENQTNDVMPVKTFDGVMDEIEERRRPIRRLCVSHKNSEGKSFLVEIGVEWEHISRQGMKYGMIEFKPIFTFQVGK